MSIQPDATSLDVIHRIDAGLAELAALGWAVKKAKARGEVEVLIANLEADAHAHHEETT